MLIALIHEIRLINTYIVLIKIIINDKLYTII